MTELDDEMLPAVLEILTELGKSMAFDSVSHAYNVATGKDTETVTQHTVLVSPPIPVTDQYRAGFTGPTDRMAEFTIYMAAQGAPFVPKLADRVTFDAKTLHIVEAKSLYSGNLIAAYELGVRA